MSILIKDMEMPKNCDECPLLTDDGDYIVCYVGKTCIPWKWAEETGIEQIHPKPDWCPLIEIPEYHGDLIDRNNANLKFVKLAETLEEKYGYKSGVPYAVAALLLKSKEEFPTIIPENQ